MTSMSWPTRNATMEPKMVHLPWPKRMAYAFWMSGTPSPAFAASQNEAGAREMAAYAARNE